jgi:hypothetical protein
MKLKHEWFRAAVYFKSIERFGVNPKRFMRLITIKISKLFATLLNCIKTTHPQQSPLVLNQIGRINIPLIFIVY